MYFQLPQGFHTQKNTPVNSDNNVSHKYTQFQWFSYVDKHLASYITSQSHHF